MLIRNLQGSINSGYTRKVLFNFLVGLFASLSCGQMKTRLIFSREILCCHYSRAILIQHKFVDFAMTRHIIISRLLDLISQTLCVNCLKIALIYWRLHCTTSHLVQSAIVKGIGKGLKAGSDLLFERNFVLTNLRRPPSIVFLNPRILN